MLEIEKLGLVELNAQEVVEVDGGFLRWWLDVGLHLGLHFHDSEPVLC